MLINKESRRNKNTFPELLESVIVSVWGDTGDKLSQTRVKQTRAALTQIRASYRFKSENHTPQPSNINYKFSKNRAGYLAAFGERHAYLSFLHLKQVEALKPDAVPQPHGKRNELVVTSLGAGACIEFYGICLYYLRDYQPHLRLRINSIEKEREWVPNRHMVFARVLKRAFPKLDIDPTDIDVDLTQDAIPTLSSYYDRLIDTDIFLVYNIMNEIPSIYAKRVWRNINFLLSIIQKPVLILLMEPSAERAEPRIYWLKELLTQESALIETKKDENFFFDVAPVCIEMDSNPESLNYRLFGQRIGGTKPTFEKTIERSHLACVKKPNSPISIEQVTAQLSRLERKRGRKGKFSQRTSRNERQIAFSNF